ncbi:MAG: helix-turn-helix domain-containing protein [Euryarchaeota archaeon]|nr:helix-turn-helix domain-containing protein [Euryarchaeota archaeon]
MSLWEVSFRTQYDYPFIRLSAKHPGMPIQMWCIWNRELLQVPTQDAAVLKEIEKDVRKAGRVVDRWVEAQAARLFLLKCTCGELDSPWTVWEANGFTDAPPAVYQDGWGYFRVITFDEDATKGLFREFSKRGPTELIRKRELSLSVLPTSVWVNSLFAGLTGKQVDALLKAHRYGYYASPRQVTTESIANALGVSRSTYEEHLRKAENRIVGCLIPYLQLYSLGDKPTGKIMGSKTSLDEAKAYA